MRIMASSRLPGVQTTPALGEASMLLIAGMRPAPRAAARFSRAFRIMASDRVPGVKTTSGAPVTQPISKEAAFAAARMEAAVRAQREKRERQMQDVKAEAQLLSEPSALVGGSHLRTLAASLDARIDGQSAAKDVVMRALRRRRLGLSDNERPLRMLFAGPSGVGKTELGMACCEALLGSCVPDKNFRRWNLSEFSHPSKFNRLTGGDPNYVGYKEGGELTNFIRQAEDRRARRVGGKNRDHTSCVILFDEVDRAADGLLTFLMNFLDSGAIASGNGDTVDATKAVIIMTTNCGRDAIHAARAAAAAAGGPTGPDARSMTDEAAGGARVPPFPFFFSFEHQLLCVPPVQSAPPHPPSPRCPLYR
jgi:ATP-dependent Clp protease ATP-binding subunit ClpC